MKHDEPRSRAKSARREEVGHDSRLMRFLATIAMVSSMGILIAGCPASSGKGRGGVRWARGRTLRVGCFGGSVMQQAKLYVGSLITAMTGAHVEFVRGTSRSHYNRLKEGKAHCDVVYLDGIVEDQAIRAGLLEKLDPTRHPALKDLEPNALVHAAYGPGVQFYTVGICYHKDRLAEARVPPLSRWADLWKYEALRGKIAIPNISHTAGMDFLIVATRSMGGSPTKLEDLRKAIKKIKALRPAIVYRSLQQLRASFDSGKVWAAPLYNSRSYAFLDGGMNVAFVLPKEKGFGHITTLNIVKGTSNRDLAEAYLNVALSPAVQVAQAIDAPFGPTNRRVFGLLGSHPSLTKRFPLGQDDFAELIVPDWGPINRVRDTLEKAWYEVFPRQP